MKKNKTLFLLIILFSFVGVAQDSTQTNELRIVKQKAFKPGEKLTFEASYGIIDAAKAVLEVKKENRKIANRDTYHFVGTGKSLGAFNWFFEVDDLYESYTDRTAMVPWLFLRNVHEGGFKMNREILFNQFKNKAKVESKTYSTTQSTQDLLSMFYYLRTMDLEGAKKDEIFTVHTFFDLENTPMKVKFLGREKCETDLGEFNCLKFRPLVEEGRVFKDEETMTIWITDDQCKVPIRVKTELLIGSLKMDLIQFEGLTGTLNGELDD